MAKVKYLGTANVRSFEAGSIDGLERDLRFERGVEGETTAAIAELLVNNPKTYGKFELVEEPSAKPESTSDSNGSESAKKSRKS